MKRFTIFVLIMLLMASIATATVIRGRNYFTVQNPWTKKRDYVVDTGNISNANFSGDVNLDGNLNVSGNVSADYYFGDGTFLEGVNPANKSTWNLSGNNLYTYSNDYNVGIGTTTPTHKLTLLGGSINVTDYIASPVVVGAYGPFNPQMRLQDTTISGGILNFQCLNHACTINSLNSNDPLILETGFWDAIHLSRQVVILNEDNQPTNFSVYGDTNDNVLFVDTTGEMVGIGTDSPTSNLEILGSPTVGDTGFSLYDGATEQFALRKVSATGYRFLSRGASTIASADAGGFTILTSGNSAQFMSVKGLFMGSAYSGQTGNLGEIQTRTGTPIRFNPETIGATHFFYDDAVVFNENGLSAMDFRVEGDTDANLLYVDAGNDRVGIGTATVTENMSVQGGLSAQNITSGFIEDLQSGIKSQASDLNWLYTRNIRPRSNAVYGIGSSTSRYSRIYTNNLSTYSTTSGVHDQLRLINTGAFSGSRPAITWENTAGNFYNARISSEPGVGYAKSKLYFEVADTSKNLQNRMVIDVNGSVGIGTTIPSHKLNVIGDINATGNITSENVFIPQYIFSHTNVTIPVKGASVWTNVTFSQEESYLKQGISHTYNDATNHTFTFAMDGVYNLHYDADVEDTSASSTDIDVAGRFAYINGTEIFGCVHEVGIIKKGVEVDLTYPCKAKFLAGDSIIFQFIAEDADVVISTHGTFGEHPESASVNIDKVANLRQQ